MQKLELIQCFRGITAILVLLHHLSLTYSGKVNYEYMRGIFSPGWAGVDFFFCLSGFIIFYISFILGFIILFLFHEGYFLLFLNINFMKSHWCSTNF